jgi:hypothetical protein
VALEAWRAADRHRRGRLQPSGPGAPTSRASGVPYTRIPVTRETKPQAEERQIELLAGVEFFVLARYMQILSGDFHARIGVPVINIRSCRPSRARTRTLARRSAA